MNRIIAGIGSIALNFRPDEVESKSEELTERAKTPELSNFLAYVSSELTDAVTEYVLEDPSSSSVVCAFVKNDRDRLLQIINETVLTAVLHVTEECQSSKTILNKLIDLGKKYFEPIASDVIHLQKLPSEVGNPQLDEIFQTLSQKLLHEAGLSDDRNIPAFFPINSYVKSAIDSALPKVLRKIYTDIITPSSNDYAREIYCSLHAFFGCEFERELYMQGFLQEGLGGEGSYSDPCGIPHKANFVWALCQAASKHAAEGLKLAVRANADEIASEFRQELQKGRFDQDHETWLADTLKHLLTGTNEIFVTDLTETFLANLFLKLFTRLLNGYNDAADRHPLCNKIQSFLLMIQAVERREDEGRKNEKLKEIMEEFSADICCLLFPNPNSDLPLPKSWKDPAWRGIIDKLLPKILLSQYRQMSGWHSNKEQNKKLITSYYNSSHVPLDVSYMIAKFAHDYLPIIVEEQQTQIASYLSNRILSELPEVRMREYYQTNKEHIEKWISGKCVLLISHGGKEIDLLKEGVLAYIESACLHLLATLGKKSGQLDLPQFATKVLKVAVIHFRIVQSIAKRHGKQHVCHVDAKTLNQEYRAMIQPHLVDFPYLDPNKEDVYQVLVDVLLKGMEIKSAKDLPLPKAAADQVYPFLAPKITELFIEPLFALALRPHSVHVALNHILGPMHEAAETVRGAADLSNPEQQMDEECGKFVLEIIGMLPIRFAQTIIAADDLQKMSGAKLGHIVRQQLSQWSLARAVERITYYTMPVIFDIEWDPSYPHNFKILTCQGDRFVGFLKGPRSAELKRRREESEKRAARRNLSAAIVQQIRQAMSASFKEWSHARKEVFLSWIEEKMGDSGVKISKMCTWIAEAQGTIFLLHLIKDLLQPLIELFWFLVERSLRVKNSIRSLTNEINRLPVNQLAMQGAELLKV